MTRSEGKMDWNEYLKRLCRKETGAAVLLIAGSAAGAPLDTKQTDGLLDDGMRAEVVTVSPYQVASNSTSEGGMDLGASAAEAGSFFVIDETRRSWGSA